MKLLNVGRLIAGACLTLLLASCAGQSPGAAPPEVDSYANDTSYPWAYNAPPGPLTPLSLTPGENNLYYEPILAASNSWGPIEIDRSNGDRYAGDGRTLTLDGKTYTRGYGTHASSEMRFSLKGTGAVCTRFTADVGVDDEVGNRGSVAFQVYLDGVKAYDSGTMTGASATKTVDLNIRDRQELRLVVTNAGDGIHYDHSDWASPKIFCQAVKPPEPRLMVVIDPTLQPSVSELPGWDGVTPQPLATLAGEDGEQADFVANALIVSTNEASVLQGFLSRWQGKILRTIDASALGVPDLPRQYLVQVNSSAADPATLIPTLQALDPNAQGALRVSSQEALRLLTVAAREAALGLVVGIDGVGRADTFMDKQSLEAPTGPGSYSPNAFDWNFLNTGSTQDIGVTEAWRLLEVKGKLGNKINLAILDGGFRINQDFPEGNLASAIPGVPADRSRLGGCSGGSCPWHGTSVLQAAMAVPDNGFGTAGPAGPIARFWAWYAVEYVSQTEAMLLARLNGVRIVNISNSQGVPSYLTWALTPWDLTTRALRSSGLLIFASAGNEGKDVDAQYCPLGICTGIEKTWFSPCENNGVICVGGLADNSKNRRKSSNYGGEDVDIFAPFSVFIGPDPDHPLNAARVERGTSLSSPYAAGVAALIWAADPSLSANEVERILLTTAHRSPDRQVRRYVNAFAAVQQVLGPFPMNRPPVVTIKSPLAGAGVQPDQPVLLSGSAVDPEGAGVVSYAWEVTFKDMSGQSVTKWVGQDPEMMWVPQSTLPIPRGCQGR
ncbi:hypothetical protein DAERI_050007 [Deinococcus aerius]|uniref:Glycosyl hydrolase family 98 putative carbohydrate-binding module domain-containing protein n=1 Tax=Deinococcus aerius TaxID=200253 RepID=A0A2I9DH58_9DEIO|nr:NPCBM/NEW2 domain-containing protein [Deinococcus aerius]GBF05498.1 hypothetical protein DAERI_050007 [Deinococcus aerius]